MNGGPNKFSTETHESPERSQRVSLSKFRAAMLPAELMCGSVQCRGIFTSITALFGHVKVVWILILAKCLLSNQEADQMSIMKLLSIYIVSTTDITESDLFKLNKYQVIHATHFLAFRTAGLVVAANDKTRQPGVE